MASKNGGYTGGVITTPAPGVTARRSSSITPTITSGTGYTAPGSTFHSWRSAAKPAYASPIPCRGCEYPVSEAATAADSAVAIGRASG